MWILTHLTQPVCIIFTAIHSFSHTLTSLLTHTQTKQKIEAQYAQVEQA